MIYLEDDKEEHLNQDFDSKLNPVRTSCDRSSSRSSVIVNNFLKQNQLESTKSTILLVQLNWTNNNNTYTITTSINNSNNDDDGLLIAFSLQHSSTSVRKYNAIVYVHLIAITLS